ncbi:MAG: hypothetical protein FJ271_21105 [Planctomycetes bacterium]|nr:hypothetical protein [Planctomycetota bacterium]
MLALPNSQAPPRFYRVHFLTSLGLTGVALAFTGERSDPLFISAFAVLLLVLFFGSVVWHLEGAPQGRAAIILASVCLATTLVWMRFGGFYELSTVQQMHLLGLVGDDFSSALVLGAATTAMLIGHSYLIASGMSMTPLLRMLLVLAASLVVRAILSGIGLWLWTEVTPEPFSETETMLWLAVRWLLGIIAPLVLGWMAWETAQIRSTQSATGILYVVVIVSFLGELTGQLLFDKTGYIL